jgi:hypothetical protein
MKILHAQGAYGRIADIHDWINGKDFRVWNGPYFSIRDIDKLIEDGYYRIDFYRPFGTKPIFEVIL